MQHEILNIDKILDKRRINSYTSLSIIVFLRAMSQTLCPHEYLENAARIGYSAILLHIRPDV